MNNYWSEADLISITPIKSMEVQTPNIIHGFTPEEHIENTNKTESKNVIEKALKIAIPSKVMYTKTYGEVK